MIMALPGLFSYRFHFYFIEDQKGIPKLFPFSRPGTIINPQWLVLYVRMSRTNFHGRKEVRSIEVRLFSNMKWSLTFLLIK